MTRICWMSEWGYAHEFRGASTIWPAGADGSLFFRAAEEQCTSRKRTVLRRREVRRSGCDRSGKGRCGHQENQEDRGGASADSLYVERAVADGFAIGGTLPDWRVGSGKRGGCGRPVSRRTRLAPAT